ncbi:MAG: hypothetical protein Q9157_002679 [Trypethelium eluteriae]
MSNIMLAGCMLLRILKSDFAQYLDEKEGKAFFLDSVSTLKLMSCANNDMPARISQILSQLWTSEKVFKSQDGSPYLTLRIRSRFATSIALDCVWWWREEFGGQPGVYPKGAGLSTSANPPQPAPNTYENLNATEETMFLPFLEDQMWSGIDWTFVPDPAFAVPIASTAAAQTSGASHKPNSWINAPPTSYD